MKLRPGCHFAPTEQGLLCRFHGSSFVVRGPAALFGLLDSRIGALMDGTDATALAAAAGPAAPVLVKILDTLVQRGYLFDLDAAGGPAPDAETAARYEDVVSHLEEHCDRPYAAFAALRSSRVSVRGGGPAGTALRRALQSFGLKASQWQTQEPADAWPAKAGMPAAARAASLTVLIDDEQEPLGLLAAAAPLPADAAILPVVADEQRIVVGPVLDGPRRLPAFLAAAERAAAWQRTDPTGPAPRRVGAALAGSLAARRALDHLAGIDRAGGAGDLLVVHGHDASMARVPFAAKGVEPTWQPLAPGYLDASDQAPPDRAAAEDQVALLTAPWRGLARQRGHSNESGRPVVGVALDPVTPSLDGPAVGWGGDLDAARRSAVLALLRAHVGATGAQSTCAAEDLPDRGVAAAGSTVVRWVLDGVLRLLAREALSQPPDDAIRWEDLESSTTRSLWSAVADYHGSPVDLAEQRIAGFDWSLVRAVDRRTGALVAAEWAPSMQTAAYAALATIFARYEQSAQKDPWPTVGTHCVELLPEAAVRKALARLTADAGPAEQGVRGLRLAADPVLGAYPSPCGWIRPA